MAHWIPQTIDKTDENALKPMVDIPPRMNNYEASTHQQNPPDFPQKGSNGRQGSYDPQYWHYCTRLLQWHDIDPAQLTSALGNEPTLVHQTKRFGDMGGYYISSNKGYVELGSAMDTPKKSAMGHYRFKIGDSVPFADKGARGTPFGNKNAPFSTVGRTGETCGWLPNNESETFWRPSSTDKGKMKDQIEQNLSTYGSNLAALKNGTKQKWNAAIVAWFHAGYQREKVNKDTGAIEIAYKGAKARAVNACDVYFFGYLF